LTSPSLRKIPRFAATHGVAVEVPKAKRQAGWEKYPGPTRAGTGWPRYLVAAEIEGQPPGVWAVTGVDGPGITVPADSVNQSANSASDFRIRSRSAARYRKRLARLKQYDAVLACLASS